MNEKLIEFILANEHADISKLLLRQKEIFGYAANFVADQINGRKRAKEKLPTWYSNPAIIYPPQQNLEQCSSEETAKFKTQIINKEMPGSTLADLTGGFGVDAYFFSKAFNSVWHVEPNYELNQVAASNHALLKASNINHVQSTAEQFLDSDFKYDWIYLDPSRKKNGRKVFRLSDCEPDGVPLLPLILKKSSAVLIKTSPLLDLKEGIKQLTGTKKIFVISVDNECKEILFLLQPGFSEEPKIVCVNLPFQDQEFEFSFEEEDRANINFDDPQEFIYEPNASILKAGAFRTIAKRTNLKKMAGNTHLYTGLLVENFPGRIFKNFQIFKNTKQQLPGAKVNIISRNHPSTPDQIKKEFKLKDGGDRYLLAFSGVGKKYLLLADRIK